mmetsp:Transcript_44295/g.87852  ORF Transcript_44295/g.87852 Transcript_44295/m.87852 type:complete len:226 (-) Transcript_44295:124-801(-)
MVAMELTFHHRPRLAILGSREWYQKGVKELCQELGRHFAQRFTQLELVTNGMSAVQQVVAEAFIQEASRLGRSLGEGGLGVRLLMPGDVRETVAGPLLSNELNSGRNRVIRQVAGNTHAEAREALAGTADACLLVSGGPGSASVADRAMCLGRPVLCMPCTGGAAAGKFWLPCALTTKPDWLGIVPSGASTWAILCRKDSPSSETAAAATAALHSALSGMQHSKL